jgi:hypothetical protein
MSAKFSVLASAVLCSLAFAGSAFANDKSSGIYNVCACVISKIAGEPGVYLSEPVGEVLYSGIKGYTKATKAVLLSDGSVVAVGAASAARVTSGSRCDINVTENSLISVNASENAANAVCIKVTEVAPRGFTSLSGTGALVGLGGAVSGSSGAGIAGLGGISLGGGLTGGLFSLGVGFGQISN